jgi:dihydroflavonol-4-reductase
MLRQAGISRHPALSCFATNLEVDDGWVEVIDGCDYVIHVASPFPRETPKHEDDLIVPAREGTLRVLRAARHANVKRVVMTSSFAAVGYGHVNRTYAYTEEDWTDLAGDDITPYIKSKTLAERAAWDFVEREGGGLELAVVNPVGIFGPVLGPNYSSSIGLIKALLDGAMRATPRIHFGVVDVRDVVALHLLAMTDVRASGQRYIAASDAALSLHDVALILRAHFGDAARHVPRMQFPNGLLRLLGVFSSAAREVLPQLGIVRNASSDKARNTLGWSPRPASDAILASGESLIHLGLHERA